MRKNVIAGTIKSDKGFYVGDICYTLSDEVYGGVWGGAGYKDGLHTDPATGRSFVVAGTAFGDGSYYDELLNVYDVDACVIGIVPAELIVKGTDGGRYFEGAGQATLVAEDGKFRIYLPDGRIVHIDTSEYAGCEDEDEDEEDDDWY